MFAKAGGVFYGELGNLPDKELLGLSMIHIYVLMGREERIDMDRKKKEGGNQASVKLRASYRP